ncbi:MAG TPA: class I SAM-dependent methyltransferase [Flavisolibacter sp.]
MNQPEGKFLMFQNRLLKVSRHLGRQARRMGVRCYRVYDHDLPEFPLIIEMYDQWVYVPEYALRHGLSDEAHDIWMEQCLEVISAVTGVPRDHIFTKRRQRKEGRTGQYQKLAREKNEVVVSENGLKFIINLTDYLDTGLFLDHRNTREMVRGMSAGKRVLNLFCYTGSFSVYAAAGGAIEIVSVDLSKTYLDWARRNMELNELYSERCDFVHADVLAYLKSLKPARFDLIIMDPPTFSNSQRMEGILEIQRDHVSLINDCLQALVPGGTLIFSTNFTRFEMDQASVNSESIRDITRQTTPFDFDGKLKRPCYLIKKAA